MEDVLNTLIYEKLHWLEKSESNVLSLMHNGTPPLILITPLFPEDEVCFPSSDQISILSLFSAFQLTIKRLQ